MAGILDTSVRNWSRSGKWKSYRRSFAKTDVTEAGLRQVWSLRRKRTPSNRCTPRTLHTHISRRRALVLDRERDKSASATRRPELPSGAHAPCVAIEQYAGDAMGSSPTGRSPRGGSGIPLGLNFEEAGPRSPAREGQGGGEPQAQRHTPRPQLSHSGTSFLPTQCRTPPRLPRGGRLFSSACICIVLPSENRLSTLGDTPARDADAPGMTASRHRLQVPYASRRNAPHAPPPHPHTSAHPHMS
ncbi:hypothetical protein DFH09DRAFT_1152606, partial [Mycena vulgaris]